MLLLEMETMEIFEQLDDLPLKKAGTSLYDYSNGTIIPARQLLTNMSACIQITYVQTVYTSIQLTDAIQHILKGSLILILSNCIRQTTISVHSVV